MTPARAVAAVVGLVVMVGCGNPRTRTTSPWLFRDAGFLIAQERDAARAQRDSLARELADAQAYIASHPQKCQVPRVTEYVVGHSIFWHLSTDPDSIMDHEVVR